MNLSQCYRIVMVAKSKAQKMGNTKIKFTQKTLLWFCCPYPLKCSFHEMATYYTFLKVKQEEAEYNEIVFRFCS